MVVRRILLFAIMLIVVITLAVAWWSQRRVAGVLVPRELERIEQHAGRIAVSLNTQATISDADALAIANTPVVRAFGATRDDADRARVEDSFRAHLEAKPWIMQLRLIDTDESGSELVRVERSGTDRAVRAVTGDALQDKGHRPYVEAGLALSAGEVHRTAVEPNMEHGVVERPARPVFRSVVPVFVEGRRCAIVVINVDLAEVCRELGMALHESGRVYVVDSAGRLVLSPEGEHYPDDDIGAWWPGRSEASTSGIVRASDGVRLGVGAVSTILEPGVRVVETIPGSQLSAYSRAAWQAAGVVALVMLGVAMIPVVLLSRSIISPLRRMASSVDSIGEDSWDLSEMPSHGEFGQVTAAFERLAVTVQERRPRCVRRSSSGCVWRRHCVRRWRSSARPRSDSGP